MQQGPYGGYGQRPLQPKKNNVGLVIGLVAGALVVLIGLALLLRTGAQRQAKECDAAVAQVRASVTGGVAKAAAIASAREICKSYRSDELATLAGRPSGSAAISSDPQRDRLEKACGVSRTVQPKYVVRGQQRVDNANIPRLNVRVSVPPGLSHEELDSQMRHAALTGYDDGGGSSLGAVTVFAWASEKTDGPYTAARAVFAPGGEWTKADPDELLEKWTVKIDFAPGYFGEKPVALPAGTSIIVANEDGPSTVLVSRSATSWGDADAVVRVASGTKARVVSSKEMNSGDGRTTLRYEIEILTTKQRGWVHAYAIRPS